MNKAKMTFRFDHNRNNSAGREIKDSKQKVIPLHNEEYRVIHSENLPVHEPFIDGQQLNQYTSDFGGWQSSFDTETLRVEKLIRESSGKSANFETGYIELHNDTEEKTVTGLNNEPLRDHRWYVPEETVYVASRNDSSSWWKVAASVTGAVVTGVAFGFFVLSMFSDDTAGTKGSTANQTAANIGAPAGSAVTSVKEQGTKAGAVNQAAAPVMAPVSTPASATPAASAAVTAVSIPAKTYSFLQSGIFSTPQGAETAMVELKKKGISGVSDKGDKFPVYAGIALTRDDAALLAKQFQQKKMDVIIKNVELPALNKIKWSAKPSEALPAYVAQGDKLLQMMAPLTLSHLTEAKSTAINADALQSVKTASQTWTGLAAAANEGLADDTRASVQKMSSAMNAAILSLDDYKKNPATASMWQAQSAMMQYVLAQKELRKAVEAQ